MELIKEPNPAFDKKLFLESLHKLDEPIKFKINGVGNIYKSKMNGKPNFFIEFEILSDFPDCKILKLNEVGDPILNEDGSKQTTFINAKDEIIGIPYPLVPSRDPNLYVVSNKTNLFKILNPHPNLLVKIWAYVLLFQKYVYYSSPKSKPCSRHFNWKIKKPLLQKVHFLKIQKYFSQ